MRGAAPERMVWASDWPHATEKADAKPTTQSYSTFWEIERQTKRPATASWWTILRRYTVSIEAPYGQMYRPPSGALKQPTNSGKSVFGNQSTALGKKIAKAS